MDAGWSGGSESWPPPAAPPPPGGGPPQVVYLPPPATSSKAVWSLVLGIVAITMNCGALTGIPAIIVGRRALRDVVADPGTTTGRGMAKAGIITGAVGTAMWVGFAVLFSVIAATGGFAASEQPSVVEPEELALAQRWADACADLPTPPDDDRCACAFDELTTTLDADELHSLVVDLERRSPPYRYERLALDRALAVCDQPR